MKNTPRRQSIGRSLSTQQLLAVVGGGSENTIQNWELQELSPPAKKKS